MTRNVYDVPGGSASERDRFCSMITMAITSARKSPCHKDQRGAAVWHHNYSSWSAAHNGPPEPFMCDGSDACRAACGKLAVHAEMRAVNRYLRRADGLAVTGMQVLHIRVVDGKPVPSGPPSCITCSRDMLDAGVSLVWLWHEEGWVSYNAAAFHRLSLQHEKHRLPVIMGEP